MSNYYYCPCESIDSKSDPKYQHYFRLYKVTKNGDILVDQGNDNSRPGIVKSWESKYRAIFNMVNPYPLYD